MKITIDIPQSDIPDKQGIISVDIHFLHGQVCECTYPCTPLPKGHGRLIDADALKKTIKENDPLAMSGFSVRLCDINNTPTIIEADKAESEVQE